MKRLKFLALGLSIGLAGCSSAPKSEFVKPGKLMGQMIQERIKQMPYQHKDELLNNMLWLAKAGEQAIPLLAKALTDENPKVRSSAAWILGRMGDRRAIPFLQQRKDESNELARLEVARSLLLLGDYSLVPDLVLGLDSDKQHVRFLCYDVLHAVTGQSFDYDHRATEPADRKKAISKWQSWWQTQSKDPWFQQEKLGGSAGQLAKPGR